MRHMYSKNKIQFQNLLKDLKYFLSDKKVQIT
jgi:hypothetical protein